MKKILGLLAVSTLIFIIAGCGADKKVTSDVVPVADIMDAIKEQMAKDFGDDTMLVDGELQGYVESDLTTVDAEDPIVALLHETMELKIEELDEGIVLAPMMNVNSNEIIILKAKEKAHVTSLKEALDRELAAQNATWERYLPDQYEKVGNNLIITKGNYLIYITYDNPEAIENIFQEKIK